MSFFTCPYSKRYLSIRNWDSRNNWTCCWNTSQSYQKEKCFDPFCWKILLVNRLLKLHIIPIVVVFDQMIRGRFISKQIRWGNFGKWILFYNVSAAISTFWVKMAYNGKERLHFTLSEAQTSSWLKLPEHVSELLQMLLTPREQVMVSPQRFGIYHVTWSFLWVDIQAHQSLGNECILVKKPNSRQSKKPIKKSKGEKPEHCCFF